MPLCGFNEKMLKGLQAFNEGLVEHGLVYRSGLKKELMNQAVKRELSDMARLLPELARIDDSAKRIITEGMVKYAMGFYLIMRAHGADSLPEHYKEYIEKLSEYFFQMDKKYYGELEGKPDDMALLAKFLDSLEV